MKSNDRLAFTVLELIMTTVMVAIILVIVPIIVLKKSVKGNRDFSPSSTELIRCEKKCIYNVKNETYEYYKPGDIDPDTNERTSEEIVTAPVANLNRKNNRYFILEIIGGGAGGSSSDFGRHGSRPQNDASREVQFLSLDANDQASEHLYKGVLTGYYLMEVGEGGRSGENGGDSKFCSIPYSLVDEIHSASANGEDENNKYDKFNALSCDDPRAVILAIGRGGISSNEQGSDIETPCSEDNKRSEQCTLDCGKESCPGDGGIKDGKGRDGIIILR